MVVSLQIGCPDETADRSFKEVPKAISKEPTDYGDQVNCTESDNQGKEFCKASGEEAGSQQVNESQSWCSKGFQSQDNSDSPSYEKEIGLILPYGRSSLE